jgi:hypothetical protein
MCRTHLDVHPEQFGLPLAHLAHRWRPRGQPVNNREIFLNVEAQRVSHGDDLEGLLLGRIDDLGPVVRDPGTHL